MASRHYKVGQQLKLDLGTSYSNCLAKCQVILWIIYIAHLESIPEELIEAAKIDGAGVFQRFKNITFPLVAPAFTVSMFLT